MTSRVNARRLAGPLLVITAALVLSSCVRLPTTGPVVVEKGNDEATTVQGPFTHRRRRTPATSRRRSSRASSTR